MRCCPGERFAWGAGRSPGGQALHHGRPLDLAGAPAPLVFDPALVVAPLGQQGSMGAAKYGAWPCARPSSQAPAPPQINSQHCWLHPDPW